MDRYTRDHPGLMGFAFDSPKDPGLDLAYSAGALVLSWAGGGAVLQEATEVDDPTRWRDGLGGAASPVRLMDVVGMRCLRLKR